MRTMDYKIKPGETLSEIAAAFDTSVSHLSLLNADKICDPDKVQAGLVIQVPFTKLEFLVSRSAGVTVMNGPVIDQCDQGHKFAKLPDHPEKDGKPRCPHCLATGLDGLRGRVIENGLDAAALPDSLVRRIVDVMKAELLPSLAPALNANPAFQLEYSLLVFRESIAYLREQAEGEHHAD